MSHNVKKKRHGGSRGTWTPGRPSKHTRAMHAWRNLAHFATRLAVYALDRYALATDAPPHGVVEAADYLDWALDALGEDA